MSSLVAAVTSALTAETDAAYNTTPTRKELGATLSTSEMPASHLPSVAIDTHGCKLNQADSGLLARQFVQAGFRLVTADEAADVYVLNSCTVTHIADRKARQALRRARRRSPHAVVVATGCYAQRSADDLDGMSEVDLVVGNTDKARLVQRVVDWRDGTPVACTVGDDRPFSPLVFKTRAMIKIQEGCNQVCAYCIVPRVRGRERSIPSDELISDVRRHVGEGYKEVVLTGTQLGSYGFDLSGVTLTGLLERILSETDVARLRVSSLQPQEISDDLLALWSDPRLCPHFHLPLQSGSESVLKRMRRRYTPKLYAAATQRIRLRVPRASVTADVIAGFPSETEAEFEETYALCERLELAAAHVFPYSVRPGTTAAHLGAHVPADVKTRRVRRLLDLVEGQSLRFRQGRVGQIRPVLWEDKRMHDGAAYWSGLTDDYVRVIATSAEALANRITPARLCAVAGDLTRAEVL